MESAKTYYFRVRELIDTLWNVNITTDNIVAEDGERINRYIMECK